MIKNANQYLFFSDLGENIQYVQEAHAQASVPDMQVVVCVTSTTTQIRKHLAIVIILILYLIVFPYDIWYYRIISFTNIETTHRGAN